MSAPTVDVRPTYLPSIADEDAASALLWPLADDCLPHVRQRIEQRNAEHLDTLARVSWTLSDREQAILQTLRTAWPGEDSTPLSAIDVKRRLLQLAVPRVQRLALEPARVRFGASWISDAKGPIEVVADEWGVWDLTPEGFEQIDAKLHRATKWLEPNTTKNGKGRTFPFGALPALKTLLEEQRAHTTEVERAHDSIIPRVFHRNGEPVRGYKRAWATACDKAAHGGKPRTEKKRIVTRPQLLNRLVHDLRRSNVRNLVRAGVSEHIAMQLTGHKTRCVFDRYDIVNEEELRAGVSKLAKLGASVVNDRGVLPFPLRAAEA